MLSPLVLLALSGHGYGHLSQCAPVINTLRAERPGLRLSVCGALPHATVAGRLDGRFEYRQLALDPVLQMHNSWEVDVPASQQVYHAFHDNWDAGLQQDIALLQQTKPDLVLADIPYRILTAAAQLEITAIALCSLNWASVYAVYSAGDSRDSRILEQMMSGYRAAHTFLTPQPSIPMPQLHNTCSIGPVARHGNRQPDALGAHFALSPGAKIVLVALGGIPTEMPLDHWPVIEDTVWLFTSPVSSVRDDILDVSAMDLPLIDMLASADVVLTKPGYGTYTEAVCNGIPLLSIERPDWPETTVLNDWARRHGQLGVISREQFYTGNFVSQVSTLLAGSVGAVKESSGIRQAVDRIQSLLPAA
jgi:hypothetical protein